MNRKFLAGFLLILCLAFGIAAQERTGNIYGVVTDAQGSPLPGTKLSLTGSRIARMDALASEIGSFRFISVPPGEDYKLTAELQGFKKIVRENIVVRVGVNVDLKIMMEQGVLEEQVTVVAKTPVVDTKKTTIQNNVTRDALQTLPSARDPWVILELSAGVLVDRENIGGSESGQQSNFLGRGDSGSNAQWNIDGVNISDPAAVGASPMYWDFDMFEEMNIQTAANDVTSVTGGININFVTPRGGNKFKGGGRFMITDKSLQSKNLPSELEGTTLVGNKIKNMYDYGFNVGGPIFKDKLWFWGSYGVQNIRQLTITGQADNTDLTTYNFKLNSQLGNHRIELYAVYNNKEKDGRRRGGGYLDEPEATYIQTGPGGVYKIQDEINFGQNFFLSLKASYIPTEFTLDPKGGRDKVIYWDLGTNTRWNTGDYYSTNRPMWYAEATGSLFVEQFLGVNHEFKFGAEFKNSVVNSETAWANGVQARLYNGDPYEVRMYNNFYEKFYANRLSGYVQDILSIDKLTLSLALRYDRQWGGILEGSNTPTNVDFMKNVKGVNYNWPSATQAAGDFPFVWNMFSPRIGLTYDLFGDKKTFLKANFSIYGSQFDATAAYTMFFLYGYHKFNWTDSNADKQVQAGELTYRSTVDLTPLAAETTDLLNEYYDSKLTPEKTMEILVGVEHELAADLGVGLNFQYRKLYDYNWSKLLVYDYLNDSAVRQVQNSDWVQAGSIQGNVYWDLNSHNVGYTFTNYLTKRPDYYQTYWALEATFKKRLSNRWMMDASFTYQAHSVRYPTRDSYMDPTDHLPVEKLDGQPMAYQAGGSGSSDVYMNSRWVAKLSGLYQLPYGFSLSGTLSAREGFISPIYIVDENYENYNFDLATVWAEKFGVSRDPNVFLLNLRLEKKFKLGEFGNVYLGLDGFNILNSNVRLARERNESADNFSQTLAIMSPRVFRFGVRLEF